MTAATASAGDLDRRRRTWDEIDITDGVNL